ncbi:MAG: iron-sulfur cluster assembly protein, partial [Nocardioides sp.]
MFRRSAAPPPVDVEAVRAAVGLVEDPEIHRPIGDLGMVGAIDVDRSGMITVEIRLTTPS